VALGIRDCEERGAAEDGVIEDAECGWPSVVAIGARESVGNAPGGVVLLPYGDEGGERFVLAQQPCFRRISPRAVYIPSQARDGGSCRDRCIPWLILSTR
jgi:hypothetical protein